MDIKDNVLDLIHKLVRKEISMDEQQLEEMMKQDSTIQEEILFQRKLRMTLENRNLFKVKGMLDEIQKETPIEPELSHKSIKPNDSRGFMRIGLIAGFILVLLSSLYFTGILSNVFETNTVYGEYLEKYEVLITVTEDGDALLRQGIVAYDQEDYKAAIPFLRDYSISNPKDMNVQLYLGISQLFQRNYSRAVQSLIPVSESLDEDISISGKWYLALAYLEDGNIIKGKFLLSELTQNERYGEKSNDLLKKIQD